ncbi:aldo-keto reductase family 1 member B1-like [Paramacrobiotus metropolitanus]|uniref:aldo-keto reductase family 1 member B1-like n=1 Tax=Paramacrobiotus metropolitanus TaxID=2943436 RepID=UPI0024460BB8|nr:aldo-keto reductase family 1 member B1-like [Paramacrobiotus metropolitanus]
MSSAPKIPTVQLPSGARMPVVGLGTWKSKPGEVKQAVKDAIDVGYRHFDCAFIYQNENEIGEAFAEKFKEGVVKREDLFICSKVWNTFHSKEAVKRGLAETLKSLQLDYLDLYIIHWPMGYLEGGDIVPWDKDGKMQHSDIDYVETWQALEEVQKSGKARDIGVSNFNVEQLKRIQAISSLPIAVNQIEVHVYNQNKELIQYCKQHNITIVGYSPLGSFDRPDDGLTSDYPPPLEDSSVKGIAEKHKKQPGQILLKYLLQQGYVVIPKSVRKERLQANLQLFDFELDAADQQALTQLCKGGHARACTMNQDWNHKHHPFPNQGKIRARGAVIQ